MQQWKALSQLEMDFGPKKAKRGNPSSDRTCTETVGKTSRNEGQPTADVDVLRCV